MWKFFVPWLNVTGTVAIQAMRSLCMKGYVTIAFNVTTFTVSLLILPLVEIAHHWLLHHIGSKAG